ncbi:hypothetical protein C474_10291 [Halogeometricum pallidum JCM 14848]|uniref:Uncharacterized protein n=1 Tax=Halogeometricum pallidum JCM 14848 TaxID=1227487 RepID=M0D7N0_HALPD|nr:hypothetical protein [Halogeometricum pallidum]ELZ30843.1 hypothetical protein C474_10291 [Halogeometricum pallidum JCM 14848]
MSQDELTAASEELRSAAEAADGETQDRLTEQAEALAELAMSDRDPDHGRLDRHMNILSEIARETSGEVSERTQAARDHVFEYRKGVEGV